MADCKRDCNIVARRRCVRAGSIRLFGAEVTVPLRGLPSTTVLHPDPCSKPLRGLELCLLSIGAAHRRGRCMRIVQLNGWKVKASMLAAINRRGAYTRGWE